MNKIKTFLTKKRRGWAFGFMNWVLNEPKALTVIMTISQIFAPFFMLAIAYVFRGEPIINWLFCILASASFYNLYKFIVHIKKVGLDESYNRLTLKELNILGGKDGNEQHDDGLCDKEDAVTDGKKRGEV